MNGLKTTLLILIVIVIGVLGFYLIDNQDKNLNFVDWVKDKFAKKCTLDSQCDSGKICKDGKCIVVPPCEKDSDCGSGKICKSGTCVNDPEFAKKQICSAVYKVITGITTFTIGDSIKDKITESKFCGIFNTALDLVDEPDSDDSDSLKNVLNLICSFTYNQAKFVIKKLMNLILDEIINRVSKDYKINIPEFARSSINNMITSDVTITMIVDTLQKSGCIQAKCDLECGKNEWCVSGICKELKKGMTYKNIDGLEFTIDDEGYLLNQKFFKDDDVFESEECTTDCDVIGMTDNITQKFKLTNPKPSDNDFLETILLTDIDRCTSDNNQCYYKIKVL